MATFVAARTATLEQAFDELPGVLPSGLVGLGGRRVLRVEFDPAVISYEQLLERFWSVDEPHPGDREHARSAVLVHSSEQEALAHAERARRALLLDRRVTAAVVRAGRCQGRF